MSTRFDPSSLSIRTTSFLWNRSVSSGIGAFLMDSLRRRRQPQDDGLVVIAEAAAEDVDPAGVAGVGLDLDLEPDRMMAGEIEVAQRHRRDFHAVDKRALPGHAPALELA